jgi:hypothetical protein
MNDGALKTSMPSVPAVGSFVTVRAKAWIVEGAEQRGPVQALTLISCEDDSQGEAIELVYAAELQPEILDPNDWSPLLTKCPSGDFLIPSNHFDSMDFLDSRRGAKCGRTRTG